MQVVFDSRLYHATSPLRFRRGHTSRRINLTFLFGTSLMMRRHQSQATPTGATPQSPTADQTTAVRGKGAAGSVEL